MRAADEFGLRGDNLGKRLGAGKKRPDLASLDIADKVREHRLIPGCGTEHRDVLQIHIPQVE